MSWRCGAWWSGALSYFNQRNGVQPFVVKEFIQQSLQAQQFEDHDSSRLRFAETNLCRLCDYLMALWCKR